MELIRLTKDTIIKSFDCGDADLNDFILNDAKAFLSKRIAYTFLITDGENLVAYFSLLNDKVAKADAHDASGNVTILLKILLDLYIIRMHDLLLIPFRIYCKFTVNSEWDKFL